jgi:hypothetical protein
MVQGRLPVGRPAADKPGVGRLPVVAVVVAGHRVVAAAAVVADTVVAAGRWNIGLPGSFRDN